MKTFKHKKSGEIATYKDGVLKSSGFCVEIGTEPSSEFWEEIIEPKKDYEVLDYYENITTIGINLAIEKKITLVKRLNDGEIFSIGDKVKNPANLSFTITSFYLDCHNDKMLCNGDRIGNGRISINKITKISPILTTEDGVDIYEDDTVYSVEVEPFLCNNIRHILVFSNTKELYPRRKFFFSKEKAEEYIILHKPCLSIKEIAPIIGRVNEGTYIDLEKLTNRLTELVKSKI